MLDKIIFGDNQFLGINHRSLLKAKDQEQSFDSTQTIYNTLKYINDIGIKSFMFTTHDQFEPVFKKIRDNNAFKDFKLIPCIPYAHKYSNSMTELGLTGTVRKYLPKNAGKVGFRGLRSLLFSDPVPTMKLLIDSEMELLRNMNVQALFLQNITTDLLLGLNMSSLFKEFINYVNNKYGIYAGFITMNYAKIYKVLIDDLKIDKPLICSNTNKIGFRMYPRKSKVEKLLITNKSYNIAMSIFASGAIEPTDAINYIKTLSGVDSILFGASKTDHIIETKELIERSI